MIFNFFRHGPGSLFSESWKHKKVLAYYMIPAFLYCLYNNLAFTNLANFDPTTYFMFMQIRLLMTGVIYQFLFKRKLSGKQWISLLILTLGCMLQKMNLLNTDNFTTVSVGSGIVLIFIQVRSLRIPDKNFVKVQRRIKHQRLKMKIDGKIRD